MEPNESPIKIENLYDCSMLPLMNTAERKRAAFLIVEPEESQRARLRQILHAHGYVNVSDAANHTVALAKLQERRITHVIFPAKKTNMPASEFLIKILEFDPGLVALPTSGEPRVDDIFGLLSKGARGFIVTPYTAQTVEEAVIMATKGEPLSDAILQASNRNNALASLLMFTLANLATTMRQARQFDSAKMDVAQKFVSFRRAADLARLFSDGGDDAMLDTIVETCVERGSGPASRLGRARKRLRSGKVKVQAEKIKAKKSHR